MKPTVGQQVYDVLLKPGTPVSVIDQQKAMQAECMKEIHIAVERGLRKYNHSFFIEMKTKHEQILINTFRFQYIDKAKCPRPEFDHSVFLFDRDTYDLKLLWTIPDRYTCEYMLTHYQLIPQEEQQLLQWIIQFKDGTLWQLMKKINKEEIDSLKLIKE